MTGPGRPGYVVIPWVMVWERSTKLGDRGTQVDSGGPADLRHRLADLVVRRRGPGGDPDDPGAVQPAIGRCFVLGSDRLVAHRAGDGVHRVGVLDVEDGD